MHPSMTHLRSGLDADEPMEAVGDLNALLLLEAFEVEATEKLVSAAATSSLQTEPTDCFCSYTFECRMHILFML